MYSLRAFANFTITDGITIPLNPVNRGTVCHLLFLHVLISFPLPEWCRVSLCSGSGWTGLTSMVCHCSSSCYCYHHCCHCCCHIILCKFYFLIIQDSLLQIVWIFSKKKVQKERTCWSWWWLWAVCSKPIW